MGKTGKRKDHKEIVSALEDITKNMTDGVKKLYTSFEDISLCPSCYSMTHTIAGKCGKCQKEKK